MSVQGILLAYSAGIMIGIFQTSPGWSAPLAGLSGLVFSVCSRLTGQTARLRRNCLHLLAAASFGLCWHGIWAWQHLQQRLPAALEGQDLTVSGQIVSLVQVQPPRQRFEFEIQVASTELRGRRVLLDYYGERTLRAGQYWQWQVRLKRPHGFANPGGFDYEAWLFQRNIVARGYVRDLIAPLAVNASPWQVITWRQVLQSRLARLPGLEQRPVLQALILGDRNGIGDHHWQLFSATGTNHLFVISGLHIGLVAYAVYWLVQLVGRRLWLPVALLPRSQIAALGAIIAALLYCLLAGFALPAQRAFIMLSTFMLGTLLRRRWPVSLRYLLALALVLSINPLAPVSQGFWLSFLAVGALLMGVPAARSVGRKTKLQRKIFQALHSQWLVFAGLLLPLSQLTGQVSLIAPLVNVIGIPLVGMVIVPLSLLGVLMLTLVAPLGSTLLALADLLLGYLLMVLEWVAASFDGTQLALLPAGLLATFLAGLASLLLLAPRCLPGRHLALPLMLPLLLPGAARPPWGSAAVDFLDVGQGLAVLVRSREHVLLYDTGDRYSQSFDLGEAVVTPVLKHFGIRRIDTLIISHGDDDHAGGAASVLRNFATGRVLYGGREKPVAGPARPCLAGQAWHWDGVEFRILGPLPEEPRADENGLSCVLQLKVGEREVLLPGDIDSAMERLLVLRHATGLRSTLLSAAHHGSKTSSGYPFLKAVGADYVVVSAGYRNAFGHPAPAVMERYRELRAAALVTAHTGMISFTLHPERQIAAPGLYRRDVRRYWRHQVIGDDADTVRYE